MDISKVLISNRGECALRIHNSLRRMGMKSVMVFSDADRGSEHVRVADEAYRIGPGPSSESYLCQDLIIDIAQKSECIAIHPGYGFLAENAEFAQKVINAGLLWIGPKPDLINLFGDKVAARQIMQKFDIPLLPGTVDPVEDVQEIRDLVSEIGFPIIIKASGGGGGKGMRVVYSEAELEANLEICKSEAQRSFGKSAVFIEKYVQEGHHIEFQILGDKHGKAWHFGHRECSVQRRHQKVIEESPSMVVKNEEVEELLSKLIQVCTELEYDSLGTFEFLKTNDGQYFFLEMNTRLQVEHSVTEMTWDIDLVELQIQAAMGYDLQIQNKVPKGSAIECRIYAEDPLANFAPAPGIVDTVNFAVDEDVRVDSYLRDGSEVPLFYDPMIAKLTVWGENRNAARLKMVEVLAKSSLHGIPNNIAFHDYILRHPDFGAGRIHTNYLNHCWEALCTEFSMERKRFLLLCAAVARMRLGWHSSHFDLGFRIMDNEMQSGLDDLKCALIKDLGGHHLIITDESSDLKVELVVLDSQKDGMLILHRSKPYFVHVNQENSRFKCSIGAWNFDLQIFEPGSLPVTALGNAAKASDNIVISPINGKIIRVLGKAGDVAQQGEVLIILEAMKMENEIRAPLTGEIQMIVDEIGLSVEKGQKLFELKPQMED